MKRMVARKSFGPRCFLSFGLICCLAVMLGAPLMLQAADTPPSDVEFQQALQAAHDLYKDVTDGKNADYIPYLAKVDPKLFGIALVTVDGSVYEIGDTGFPFAIESISKVFSLCRVMQDLGSEAVEEKVGVNASGFPFNSVLAIELEQARTVNPLVNAGAMATVSLISGKDADQRWEKIIGTMNQFAGRTLEVNQEVYRSESETNLHNKAIILLLQGYGRLYGDPDVTLDLYTRQCSVSVTARDLAVMGATLANGGINPITGQNVIDAKYVPNVLALMMTTGLYETTGQWIYRTGMPAKSGVGGGIMAVVPGRFAIASFSPPLDISGNSVRGIEALTYLSQQLGANTFLPRSR